jgi:nicotinate-nucleotide adenylyltransferase
MTKRIAVYGGSFNPFGNQHRDVLRHIGASGKFDEIFVIPSVAHPLKEEQFPFEHRLNMAELAVWSGEWAIPVEVMSIERQMLREGIKAPLFTIKVLRFLAKVCESMGEPEGEFRFVIGPDIIEELDRWEGVQEIRDEFGFFETPDMGIHSTQIREMIQARDAGWKDLVSPQVARYIETHDLYQKTSETEKPS